MSQASTGTTVRTARPSPNVYSVLAIVAFLALAVGVGALWSQNIHHTQFDEIGQIEGQGSGMNPFFLIAERGGQGGGQDQGQGG
ncbi:MAG: hypothetical protein GVY24_04860 [Planctomycetes bacterium]|jgi:hypothetical protein|nr:hypothetical protein [Planctomycetota bacterium]